MVFAWTYDTTVFMTKKRIRDFGRKSWKIVKFLRIFGWNFLNMSKLRFPTLIRTSFAIKPLFLVKRWYFNQNLKHFRKFFARKIHRAIAYLDCLFTTEACGFKNWSNLMILPLLDAQDDFLVNFRSNLINFEPILSQFWSKMEFWRTNPGEQRTYLMQNLIEFVQLMS